MNEITDSNYLANQPITKAMQKFAKQFTAGQRVLDIGCGKKPYAKFFQCEYIGLDPSRKVNPDIVADAWNIPVSNNSFDGIILNQSLEHIEKTQETIQEASRVLKPGGFAIITVPQTMKNHSRAIASVNAPVANFDATFEPYWRVDYWRFTKFGLIVLFKEFEIVDLRGTTGYIASLCQLTNYFLASFGKDWLFWPVYLTNNTIGQAADIFFNNVFPPKSKFHHFVYNTLTINYILVVKKPL